MYYFVLYTTKNKYSKSNIVFDDFVLYVRVDEYPIVIITIYNAPVWDIDQYGMNLTDPTGTIIARLNCDANTLTMTFEYFTEDFRLTPEEQMSILQM